MTVPSASLHGYERYLNPKACKTFGTSRALQLMRWEILLFIRNSKSCEASALPMNSPSCTFTAYTNDIPPGGNGEFRLYCARGRRKREKERKRERKKEEKKERSEGETIGL
jgi:hypothetical protein